MTHLGRHDLTRGGPGGAGETVARVPAPLQLPPRYAERPLTLADAGAVTRVMAANELATVGEVLIEEADIVAEWRRPSFDVGDATVGVLGPDSELVAYAECSGGARADAAVHPDHWDRGIGTALANWISARAAELEEPVIGMPVPQGSPGDRLLESLNWFPRWESWVLALPEDAAIPVRELPAAYAISAATPQGHEQVWTVIEDAFLEWSEREREPYADWVRQQAGHPQGPAQPWPGPGPPRRRVRRCPRSRSDARDPVDGLPHRRPRPLSPRRHGGRVHLGPPRDPALIPPRRPLLGYHLASRRWTDMSDVLIRGLSDDELARIDTEATRLGLTRNEYLRRWFTPDALRPLPPARPVAGGDFAKFAPLADRGLMRDAWS